VFIDRVVVRVKAGDGGSGIVSFRREKFVPMGGPDGGEGGRGGDIVIVGDSNLSTLLDYTYRDSWTAPPGDHGSGANKSGRSGADVVMPVPVGTVIKDVDTKERLGEVLEDGERIVVARGGRGGKGNSYFVTSTHQSPREYQPGEDGAAQEFAAQPLEIERGERDEDERGRRIERRATVERGEPYGERATHLRAVGERRSGERRSMGGEKSRTQQERAACGRIVPREPT